MIDNNIILKLFVKCHTIIYAANKEIEDVEEILENISDEQKELTRLICESIPPCFFIIPLPGADSRYRLPDEPSQPGGLSW